MPKSAFSLEKLASLMKHERVKNIPLHDKLLKSISSDYCNWVIPGRLMCGPYPGRDNVNFKSDQEAKDNIQSILNDGITFFICLQEEEPSTPKYVSMLPKSIPWLHYSIVDHIIPSHKEFLEHIFTILQLLRDGHNIYIHCAGGHGRTGTYVACLLMIIYGISSKHALYYTQYLHNLRRKTDKRCKSEIPCMSPENDIQIEFVKSFESLLKFIL